MKIDFANTVFKSYLPESVCRVNQSSYPLSGASNGKPWLLSLFGARGFELSATGLSLFVVAFCALQLSVRCLSLRSIFYLNMLALLHCCYMMERLWDMGCRCNHTLASILTWKVCQPLE